MEVCLFLPTRLGSQRVKNKNTRPFCGYQGGLLENKITQLLKTKHIDEIVLSTNDPLCIHIAEPFTKKDNRLKIIERPEELCLDSTNLQDLIAYVPTVTSAQHILWAHVTTPIANEHDYDNAIKEYKIALKKDYDSLISVTEFKNFLLDSEGKQLNNNTNILWPRTQDLDTLYEVNHVIFMAPRETYLNRNRVGSKPLIYLMNKIKSFDIDWNEDFIIAETLYAQLRKV